MAFSFGFYNSKNHDRLYDAMDVSRIFDGIIRDGVYETIGNRMIVKAYAADNTVLVQTGRAWFNHTWNYIDSAMIFKLEPRELMLNRYDTIVIDVNEETRTNQILAVKGTAAPNPVKPTLINTEKHHQYPLCHILRRYTDPVISQADIENTVGTAACPFVIGVLEIMSIDDILAQWYAEWDRTVNAYYNNTVNWSENLKSNLEHYYTDFKLQMENYYDQTKIDFQAWYDSITYILEGDQAYNLLQLINNNKSTADEDTFNRYYGMINSNTTIYTNDTMTTVTAEATINTSFSQSGKTSTITTVVTPNNGLYKYTKTTTITEETNGNTTIKSSFLKANK